VPHFFGLTPNNKDLYLEQIFALVYHLGFTYQDAYNCPVWQRFWFINRLKYEFDKAKEQKQAASSQSKRNTSGGRVFRKAF
tara:strand:- start:916 stop:1158 length:243 start_codon:yes stop_codon:yes gene_type:complete